MLRPLAVATALLASSSALAEAKVRLSLTNQTLETEILYSAVVPAILTDAGATVGTFRLPAAGRVIITYTAECRLYDLGSYVTVNILIDGVSIKPTSPGDDGVRFCTSNSYDTHSITVTKALKAGTHKIRVDGSTYGSTSGLLRKSSLVVFD